MSYQVQGFHKANMPTVFTLYIYLDEFPFDWVYHGSYSDIDEYLVEVEYLKSQEYLFKTKAINHNSSFSVKRNI